MKASELISTIKNLRSGGKTSDDKSMSDFQWLAIIDYYRAQLIRQQLAKGYRINQECIQKLNVSKILLTQNPIEKCELISNDIPRTIETVSTTLFTYVGTESGKSYQRTTYNKAQWDSYSRYIGQLPKWYELGNKIVVKHHQKNLKLNIMGVFENPIKVLEFNDSLNEMQPFDWEYPMSNTMVDTIIKMIADSELKLSLLLPKDELNDGRDGQ